MTTPFARGLEKLRWGADQPRGGVIVPPDECRAILEALTHPEPPRDSGEADAVNGPTALGTQHDIGTEPSPLGSDQSRP